MRDDVEKIANASLRQRDRQDREIHRLREALVDIEELVDGYEDVDDGQPNLAMRVLTVARIALKREP